MGSYPSKPQTPPASTQQQIIHEKIRARVVVDKLAQMTVVDRPASADGSLTLENIDDWEASASQDPKIALSRTILSQAVLADVLKNRSNAIQTPHIFNTSIPFITGPITSQASSGRCWLFAATNIIRYSVQQKLNLPEFQLSQSYLFLWDKLEKANYYLELSIQNANLPLDDRLILHLANSPVQDGGQHDMVVNLLERYGVVPQALFPESTSSSTSSPLNKLLTTRLREHALILRRLHKSLADSWTTDEKICVLRAKKEELMKEVWNVLTATLGVPPNPNDKFTYEYLTKSGTAKIWEGTPREFYKQFSSSDYPMTEAFSLINDPRNEYGKLYTVDKLGNVWGGRPVLYVNTEADRLKSAVVKSIKAGHPVFFGCDVGQSSERNSGIMDTGLYEYENAFDIKLGLTKAERLQVNESSMTHAMVITAVHIDPSTGKPIRYKVENSWGDKVGDKGYFVMTDAWFEEFVYQVVVPKQLADKDHLKVFQSDKKVVLPAWDPMVRYAIAVHKIQKIDLELSGRSRVIFNVYDISSYISKTCPYAARTQIALREAGAKFNEYEIDLQHKPEWYSAKINPASKVPAIAFGGPDVPPDQPSPESIKLRESLSIIEWVADQHPNSALLPKDPIGRYKVRLFIETFSSTVVPGFYGFTLRDGNPESLIKGLEAMQELLPDDTKYAVSDDFTNADVAAAPFVGRLETVLRNDVGIFAPGEGKRVYTLLTQDPKFEKIWRYFLALKERYSFQMTYPEDLFMQGVMKRVGTARKTTGL